MGFPRHLMMTYLSLRQPPPAIQLGCPPNGPIDASRRKLTFLPSGMLFMSTSTLAMARTSAEADMLTRNSAITDRQQRPNPSIPRPSRGAPVAQWLALSHVGWWWWYNIPWTVLLAPAAVMAPMAPTMK